MYLETPRLLIRNFTMDDFPGLWALLGDPETMEFMVSYTEAEAREFLCTFCVERTPPGAYAAVSRTDGALIAYLLCNQPEERGVYELGWIVRRDLWRRGYAYEAVSALMDCLFRVRNAHKVVAETIDAGRCVPLMEKLGLCREGVLRQHCRDRHGQWRDLYWYGLLNREYLC